MEIWGIWLLIRGYCHPETRNLNGAAQMSNPQPLVWVARVLILLAARKSYDFSPAWGKRHDCPKMSLNPFGCPFPLASAIQSSSSAHRQPSSFPEGASCPLEAALRALYCTSDISALVRGVFEIGFAEKALLGVKDAGRLLRSEVEGVP